MKRDIFSQEHDLFRNAFKSFVDREVVPHQAKWREDGMVSREVWRKAGDAGLLCCNVPEAYGGSGSDFLVNCIVIEDLARGGITDLIAAQRQALGL